MADPTADHHPTAGIGRLLAGDPTAGDRRRLLEHLLAGCADCRAQLSAVLRPGPADPAAIGAAVERAIAGTTALVDRFRDHIAAAESFVDRLAGLDPDEQRRRVEALSGELRRAVCRRLIGASRSQRRRSAAAALHSAELAVAAAAGLGDDPVTAEAWAELGNARRLASDLRGAGFALAEAERRLATTGADPLLRAEVLLVRAPLATWDRRFEDAESLLERAMRLFAAYGEPRGVAQALIQLAQARGERGAPESGIPAATQALELLSGPDDTMLRVFAVHTLIYLVAQAGDARFAAELIERVRPWVESRMSGLHLLRFEWLQARVDRELGRFDRAAERFETIRQRYHDEGIRYERALVSLDLAVVYAQQGRRGELAALAASSAEVFTALGVGREWLASLALLGQAGTAEAIERIAALAAGLEHAHRERASSFLPKV